MSKCDTCGNDYDKAFQVTMGSRTMTFDSFECAIQAMAPTCIACGCRIIDEGASIELWASTIAVDKAGSSNPV
jgi:hypothetical protein